MCIPFLNCFDRGVTENLLTCRITDWHKNFSVSEKSTVFGDEDWPVHYQVMFFCYQGHQQ